MPVRWSATRLARSSCTSRTTPLISSMARMMATVVISRLKLEASSTSVTKEMSASTNKTMEKGLIKARRSRYSTVSEARPASRLLPYRVRRSSAS